jgi:hypothetical protein
VVAIIGVNLLFVYLTVYTSIATFFTYVVTGVTLVLVFVGAAAVVFPSRMKEVFESAPKLSNRKVGGIPVISIMGVALIIVAASIAYASLLPALVGPLNPSYIEVVASLFVIGLVFYWASYALAKSRGVPVDLMHREIPPE